jgi:hypothetical protein
MSNSDANRPQYLDKKLPVQTGLSPPVLDFVKTGETGQALYYKKLSKQRR